LGIFRLYYIQTVPLSEDEAYYWVWSRHLDWGYFDQGPLVAWLIRLGTMVLGDTELGVRAPAVLLGLGLSLILYDFCRRVLKDAAVGLWVVVAANTTLLFSVGSIIHTYDTSQAFFWALALYLTALALYDQKPAAWYGAGIATGLAMLAKYSSALLPLTTFLFLLTNSKQRFWLSRKEPWIGTVLAALVFSPNLIWNANHHWATLAFNLGRAGQGWKFTLFDFLGGQAVLLGPIGLVLLVWGLGLAWRQSQRGHEQQALLLWTSIPVLLLFLGLSVKTRVQGNWPAPGYLAALPAAVLALKPKLLGSAAWRRWGLAALLSGLLLVLIAHMHVPLLRSLELSPRLDPTKKIHGWPQMGVEIGKVLRDWPGKQTPVIFGLNYQLASLPQFYIPGQPPAACLFLPKSKPNAYLFWPGSEALKGREGLAVVYGTPPLGKLFQKAELIKKLSIKGPSGAVIHNINLYRCQDFKGRDFRPY
jgi:undecaprenyl-diphosphatase